MTEHKGRNRALEEISAILAEGYLRLQRKTSHDPKTCDDQPELPTNSQIIELDRSASKLNTLDSTVNSESQTRRSSNG